MNTIQRPFTKFFKLESLGSVILIIATIFALIAANTGLAPYYHSLWEQKLYIGFGNFKLEKDFIHWINDGLMAIFFFVIGLEIKREVLVGELNNIKKASLPIVAAIGGMVVPIVLFLLLNGNNAGRQGWGIPMATDIAFSLGILQLLGRRVPIGLKVFLIAFAIVDDIGAVLVIAIFYSSNIQWLLIIIAAILILVLAIMGRLNFFSQYIFYLLSFVIWILFLKSGIHPTISGILIAFTVPVARKIYTPVFSKKAETAINIIKHKPGQSNNFVSHNQQKALHTLKSYAKKTVSPLQSIEYNMHGWVTYFIMPVFAFANAGVTISSQITPLTWNIFNSMLFGKTLGITLFAVLAVKTGIASLPKKVNFKHIFGVSILGGLGFTMSLFISGLSYTNAELINSSKTGILLSSLAAGAIGYFVLKKIIK